VNNVVLPLLSKKKTGHEQARAAAIAEDELDFAQIGNIVRKKEARSKQKASRSE
jgi:hypothetical protein